RLGRITTGFVVGVGFFLRAFRLGWAEVSIGYQPHRKPHGCAAREPAGHSLFREDTSHMPIVDVIVPFFNTPIRYVHAALQSIIDQTCCDWRAIVVNDGSRAANTREIEDLLPSLEENRILYRKMPHQGVSAARNTAIRISDAPYIAFLDADD